MADTPRPDLSGSYDPAAVEARWYAWWSNQGFFTADDQDASRPTYTITIPPPNVTGSLHMGHALMVTIQDALVRHKRMDGYNTLWLPGIDHAGIATQTVVERQLRAEGLTRHDLGRDKFLERVWAWKEKSGGRIFLQMRRMGCSLDWSRERFTMDEGFVHAVLHTFVRLYDEGLIYQDDRLVNWDPVAQTVLSDLEVESQEEDGFLWHIAYPVAGTEERLVVATTRPETLLGDTAVAIHPDDPRYKHLHGRFVELPLTGRQIPIVCDPVAADMNFGSGAVKITPAHDFNDFETGRRNNLPRITVLDLQGRINDEGPERFRGLDRYEARTRILDELRAAGLLVQEQPYRFSPGRSQRSGVIVEPLSIGKQWFVRMTPLAGPSIEAVRDGRIQILPETWEKNYFQWMENIRDWCISRQLWWGHRIPAWTCSDCGGVTVQIEAPSHCKHCQSTQIAQCDDTLDTWFSSALWPFATLGWPENTAALAKFHPNSVMETGFDILYFWVARMIAFGLHLTGEVPFKTVYLHAMVRDRKGDKMSKTKGNVIDPLHLVDGLQPASLPEDERQTYAMLLQDFPEGLQPQGADALRFTLATYAAAGRDIKLDVRRVEGYRQFMNKMWNAARFVQMNLEGYVPAPFDASRADLSAADRWILTQLGATTSVVNAALDQYRIADATQALYEFFWQKYCDWYLELAKPVIYASAQAPPGGKEAAQATLVHVLDQTLRLMHPLIPFITEEIWQSLPLPADREESLCIARWPRAGSQPSFDKEAAAFETVLGIITGLRRVRADSNLPPSRVIPTLHLFVDDPAVQEALRLQAGYIRTLARVETLHVHGLDEARPDGSATTVAGPVEVHVPLVGLVDFAAERVRLEKELARAEGDLAHAQKKLANERYLQNAKPEALEKDRKKLADTAAAVDALAAALARLPVD